MPFTRHSKRPNNTNGEVSSYHSQLFRRGIGGHSAGQINQAGKNYYNPQDNSLVGCWLFDGGVGTIVNDESLYNSTAYPGTIGNWVNDGMQFDASQEQYLSVLPDSHLDQDSSLSILSWIKLDTITTSMCVLCKSSQNNTSVDYYLEVTTTGKLIMGCYDGVWHPTEGATSLTTDRWYLVGGTFDGSIFRIYLDGVMDNNTTESVSKLPMGGTLEFGRFNNGIPGNYFNGTIHSIFICARNLSAQEIENIYDAGPYYSTETLSYEL